MISAMCCIPADSVCVHHTEHVCAAPRQEQGGYIYPFCLNSRDMISSAFLQLDLMENARKWRGHFTLAGRLGRKGGS